MRCMKTVSRLYSVSPPSHLPLLTPLLHPPFILFSRDDPVSPSDTPLSLDILQP